MSHSVLLLGASSQIGYFLLPRLLGRGCRVHAVSRTAPPLWSPSHPGLSWQRQVTPEAGQVLVSLGPLSVAAEALKQACSSECPPVAVLATSSASVLFKQESEDAAERRQIAHLLQAEQYLFERATASSIPLLLLRPTLLWGAGLDRSLTPLASLVARFGFLPVSSRANGLRQPLHADDLARLAGDWVQGEFGVRGSFELGGGETLDYREMLGRLFDALGRPRRLLSLPPWLLRPAVSLAGRVTGMEARASMVRRQAMDLTVDDSGARNQLGFRPRGFRPQAADFLPPGRP